MRCEEKFLVLRWGNGPFVGGEYQVFGCIEPGFEQNSANFQGLAG
jgi:hypothetical protein